ncbi:MAG: TPM domain-containing protein [Deltaproteobacteria bacterium]|nr:TPM domain-containing protein [Deltaproteobacteria bacterium]
MKISRLACLFLLALAFFGWVSPAQALLAIPAVPDHYVNDEAGLLSAANRQSLEDRLAQFERDTSNQILVVTFPDLQGEPIEDFSIRLAEKWKPGQSVRNNGAILVVSKNDHKVRIEAGYGLEGVLSDAVSSSILQREILPHFKQGDFDAGIRNGVDAILQATRGEYHAIPQAGLPHWLVVLIVFLLILLLLKLLRRAGAYGLYRSGSYYGGGWGAGGSWGGGSSHSSGGFSSGGGSFGGGGASGSW